jgi:hypothetical protein
MLSPYARTNAMNASLATKLNISDTAAMLTNRIGRDTVSLSDRINALNFNSTSALRDTASVLRAKILLDSNALATNINLKVNIADTAAMLSPYARTNAMNVSLAAKLNISDTAAMLTNRIGRDTVSLSNRIDALNISSTSALGDTATALRAKILLDSNALASNINLKVNIADTAAMLSPYATKAFVTASVPDATTAVKGKVKLAGDLTGTADLPVIAANAVTSAKILDGEIVNADISDTAAIVDTKLATIATAGKVSNSATTATTANVSNSIVARDVWGSFEAGNITASGLNSSGNILVNGVTVGRPGGSGNIGIGQGPFLWASPVGGSNTVLGDYAFTSSTGSSNTAIGHNAIRQGSGGSGDNNTAVGAAALSNAQGGNNNTGIGANTLNATTGSDNASLGYVAGNRVTTGNQNTFLGSNADVVSGNGTISNATALGYGATVGTSNTIQLGNDSVTAVKTRGAITGASFIKSGGTSSQFLKADGSVDNSTYLTTSTASSNYLPLSGGTLTGQLFTPSVVFNNSTTWDMGSSATGFSLYQGGCCARLIMDNNGKLAIGANYLPSYQLDVEGDGRFTSDLTANSFVKSGGTSSQFLKADGSIDSSTYLTTATAGAGFVDLTNAQTVGGIKTFSSDLNVNSLTVGLGSGSVTSNTAVGYATLQANTNGFLNTAFGVSSLYSNTTGSRNTAIGSQALYQNNGNDNTALGYITLQNNTTGNYNVGVGSEVLFSNTSGGYNTAVGPLALKSNTSASANTAIGHQALTSNTTGGSNTATGQNALPSNTIGSYNVAYGVQSLEQSTTANQNTAIGAAAIDRNTTGSSNTVIGAFAGRYISDGSTSNTVINNSVLIGAETKPNADNEYNQIVIGYQAKGNGSNTIQLGNSAITNVNTSGSITANAEISSEITSDFTISSSNAEQYKGKVLICNPNSEITITFSNNLPVGFNCMVLQKSSDANKINFAGGTGVTMKNRNNYTATAGNYAIATIVNIGNGIIVTAGDMQ